MNEINNRLNDSSWDHKIASLVIARKKSQRNRTLATVTIIFIISGLLFLYGLTDSDSSYYINSQIYTVIENAYVDSSDLYSVIEVEESIDLIIYTELAFR